MDEYQELKQKQRELDLQQKAIVSEIQHTSYLLWRIKEEVIMAQGEKCPYCEAALKTSKTYSDPQNDKGQVRLKTPICRGGEEVKDNLVICCSKCGPKKSKKTHEEFLAERERALDWDRRYQERRERRRLEDELLTRGVLVQ